MRKHAGLVLLTAIVLTALAPLGTAEASTTYSVHTVRDSATGKGIVRAYGSWAVWSEADLLLYNAQTREFRDIDPGEDYHLSYDVGPGFVAYTSSPVIYGEAWTVKLYEIASGRTADLATASFPPLLSGPTVGDGFVAWADSALHVYDTQTATETTYGFSSGYCSLAADGEDLVWIEPPVDFTVPATAHAFNTRTGEHRSVAIPSFSPGTCSVSTAGVVLAGEGPKNLAALYLWSPDSGHYIKLVGAENQYHYMEASRLSARYVAWSNRSTKEYPNNRIAVMDLFTGTWELVQPFVNAAIVGEVEGNRVWYSRVKTDFSGSVVGYVDIIETSNPTSDEDGASSDASNPPDETIVESETIEATASAPPTATPSPTASGSVATPGPGSGQPEATEADTDTSRSVPWLALAAVAGLSLTGGGLFLARRRAGA